MLGNVMAQRQPPLHEGKGKVFALSVGEEERSLPN